MAKSRDIFISMKQFIRKLLREGLTPTDDKVGKVLWFEYHCFESPKSGDAEIWYRSHQQVKVLGISEIGGGDTPQERGERGEPRVYKVRFKDGLEWDVFEDELMGSPEQFYRPDPPKKP